MSANYFIFDENKCVGCQACVVACINENGFQEPQTWRNVHSSNPQKHPDLPLFYLSMSCNHCENAVCMDNCPALAYSRSISTSAILHQQEACIGCQYCTWHCPYDAPKYNPFVGVIEKCNFCEERLLENQKPACASLCPTGALDFSFDNMDKTLVNSNLNRPVNTQASIIIKEAIKNKAPKMDKSLFADVDIPEKKIPKGKNKITAVKELPLFVFTLILPLLSAFSVSNFVDGFSFTRKILFLSLGLIAAFFSTMHLGKPQRAWRALLNVKKSWLSREILFFGIFYTLLVVKLMFFDFHNAIMALFAGLMLLSVDMLYKPAQIYWKIKIHSAQSLFMAISLYLLLNNFALLFLIIMLLRLGLFVFQTREQKTHALLRLIRILSIIISLVLAKSNYSTLFMMFAYLPGEIIDRILFYEDLEVA